jgi:hypothetical protein
MKVFIICPTRNISDQWREGLLNYATMLESEGHKVHLPFRDVEQNDKTGFNICSTHANAMRGADQVHIAYDGESEGCIFDLGMAFVLKKDIYPITGYFPNLTNGKSYSNMVWDWDNRLHFSD